MPVDRFSKPLGGPIRTADQTGTVRPRLRGFSEVAGEQIAAAEGSVILQRLHIAVDPDSKVVALVWIGVIEEAFPRDLIGITVNEG